MIRENLRIPLLTLVLSYTIQNKQVMYNNKVILIYFNDILYIVIHSAFQQMHIYNLNDYNVVYNVVEYLYLLLF